MALQRRQKEPSPPPTRLSQLNYAMLKDGALRKKLQEIGIPNWGSKDLMKRRHIEWLNIHNSNCDAHDSVRKSKKLLLQELDEWENTQGGKAHSKDDRIMRKDFDANGHARSHKSDFDDLIARARQKRAVPKSSVEVDADQSKVVNYADLDNVQDQHVPAPLTGTNDTHDHGSESHYGAEPGSHPRGLAQAQGTVQETRHPQGSLSMEVSGGLQAAVGEGHDVALLNVDPSHDQSHPQPNFTLPIEEQQRRIDLEIATTVP
jgi:E3 ubiquitin-protein ligase RAD18